MKTQILIIVLTILAIAGIASADFTDTGKAGNAFERAESLKSDFERGMNKIISIGTQVDQLKTQINTQLGASEAAAFQTKYIDVLAAQLNDVAAAWDAAR